MEIEHRRSQVQQVEAKELEMAIRQSQITSEEENLKIVIERSKEDKGGRNIEAMIQEALEDLFKRNMVAAPVTRVKVSEMGNCLTDSIIACTDPTVSQQNLGERSQNLRRDSVNRFIEKIRTATEEQLRKLLHLATPREGEPGPENRQELIDMVARYGQDFAYTGEGGDIFALATAYHLNRPIVVVDLHEDREANLRVIYHDTIFADRGAGLPPILLVYSGFHYEPLWVEADQEANLWRIYDERRRIDFPIEQPPEAEVVAEPAAAAVPQAESAPPEAIAATAPSEAPAPIPATPPQEPTAETVSLEAVDPTAAPTAARAEGESNTCSTEESQADGAFLRQLSNLPYVTDSESAFSATIRRRQDAGRPVHSPLLQFTDELNGSTTAALNVFLSTELAVFLNDLPNIRSQLLKQLQQYVLAPPGTRGTTNELCRLMEEEVPEVLNLPSRNNVPNSEPIDVLQNLIYSVRSLLSEDQQEEWKKLVNIKFQEWYNCQHCLDNRWKTKTMLVLTLPSVDQHKQPVGSLREALQALKDMNEKHEVNKACPNECGAKKTMKASKIINPPRVAILHFPIKERNVLQQIEIDYEIYLPQYHNLPFRLNSIVSNTNDRGFYADIVDGEQGVWRSNQDLDPYQTSRREFNEGQYNGIIFVYERLKRTRNWYQSNFSWLSSEFKSKSNVSVLLRQEIRGWSLMKGNKQFLQPLPGSVFVCVSKYAQYQECTSIQKLSIRMIRNEIKNSHVRGAQRKDRSVEPVSQQTRFRNAI